MEKMGSVGVFLLLVAWPASSQSTQPRVTFEVATVRPSTHKTSLPGPLAAMPAIGVTRGGPGSDDPERILYSGVSLTVLLTKAFGVPPGQLSAPSWLDQQAYDIEAKIPPGTTPDQFAVMLQNLLKERFGLVVHRETREGAESGYRLVLARGGPRLKASEPVGSAKVTQTRSGGRITVTFHAYSLANFAKWLGMPLANTQERSGYQTYSAARVQDATDVPGEYDFTLEFAGSTGPAGAKQISLAAIGPSDQDGGVDIFTAIQRQLGLRLEETRLPLTMLMVDHIDRVPTDN